MHRRVITDLTTTDSIASKKDGALETIRGIAAFVVVAWHCLIGFYPEHSGAYENIWPDSKQFSHHIWFGIFNGTAAVVVFFTLSGYVLTKRYFLDGNSLTVVRGAVKRWPRLLGPVLLVVLFSWLLFKLDAYRFAEASQFTKSEWLRTFANGIGPRGFSPSFGNALDIGSIGAFFRGSVVYDTSLWTMRYELAGSYLIFGFALLSRPLIASNTLAFLFLAIVIGILCHAASPFYSSFIVGACLAALPPRKLSLHPAVTFCMILGSLCLLAISAPLKILSMTVNPIDAHTAAASLLIIAVQNKDGLLHRTLNGSAGKLLGWLSFPLYLIHVPILCSLGCSVLLWTSGNRPLAIVATVAGAIALSLPLAVFNDWWVRRVNTIAARAVTT